MNNSYLGKRVLIVGSGISGKGAAFALKNCGALIYFFDGTFHDKIDLIVMSPGVKDNKIGEYAASKNIPVIGEIELGFTLDTAPVIAITGTNGKTTTTMLIGEMLSKSGLESIVCGNIGYSYSKSIFMPHRRTVLEVSSFQLLNVKEFAPKVAVITNISPDHLDRHGNMENYINAKLNICRAQCADDYIITTQDIGALIKNSKSNLLMLGKDIAIKDNTLNVLGKQIISIDELKLKQEHNIVNALFASTAAILTGANVDAVCETLINFEAAEHRLSFVGCVNGKNYYNDSKGTNIGAAIAAAKSMDGATALIAGGSYKGYEFDELFISLPSSIKYVIGMGEVKNKLEQAAIRQRYNGFLVATGLEDAVEIAKTLDVKNVLLSPAAASFDCYSGYDKRGEHFERLIRA